eukprot:3722263-Rhodomonas_salina.1
MASTHSSCMASTHSPRDVPDVQYSTRSGEQPRACLQSLGCVRLRDPLPAAADAWKQKRPESESAILTRRDQQLLWLDFHAPKQQGFECIP